MKIHAYILSSLLLTVSIQAAEFDLGTHGILSVTVPDDWSVSGKVKNGPDGNPVGYDIAIKPRSDANAKCMLTILYTTNGAPDKEVIRKAVLRATEKFVAESVEKKQELKDFSLTKGYGCYCVFTDASLVGKEPKPGSYKVMGSGQVQPANNMVGVVSLFADEPSGAEMKAMLNMINSLKVKPGEAE